MSFFKFKVWLRSYWGRSILMMFITGIFFIPIDRTTRKSEFCGGCHFEKPLYRTWANSGHAVGSNFYGGKVECVDCHVTPGISGYVRSKFRGLRHISIQYLSFPHEARNPAEVRTDVPDENCIECHSAAPHRMNSIAEIDMPLLTDTWIESNQVNYEPNHLARILGLIMAHRSHMTLAEECAECHVEQLEKYPEIVKNKVVSQLPQNPMSCVSCHRNVVHGPLKMGPDSSKYYVKVLDKKVIIDLPNEKKVCGICHRDNSKCEWERDIDHNTFSINSQENCTMCHPKLSDF